jgi:DNA (cytosine-5)-methyltransferase 1
LSTVNNNNGKYASRAHVRQEILWDVAPNEGTFSDPKHHLPDSLPITVSMSTRGHEEVTKPPPIKQSPAIFSFFAGAGFLDLGFETSGFQIVHVNEIYSPFLQAYRYAREHLNIAPPEYGYYGGSILDFIEGKQKEHLTERIQNARRSFNVIGFIGGPPCPDFSVGGKNRGREGDNGKLSAIYFELICQQKPDFYLFENVKGLWKTKRHREFYEEIKARTKEDYVTIDCLVNAIEYGVPQDRDRVILLGFRKDLIANGVIEFNHVFFPWKKYACYSAEEVFASPWPTTCPFEEDSVIPCGDGIIQELTVEHWFRKNDVLNHPNAEQFFKPQAGLARFRSVYEGDDSKKSFKRLHRWRYSPTAAYGNNEVHLHPYKARRISVAEALAIQALPNEFTLPLSMTLTDAFKATGNGVPFLMSKAIARTVLDLLGGFDVKTHSIQHSRSYRAPTQESTLPIH